MRQMLPNGEVMMLLAQVAVDACQCQAATATAGPSETLKGVQQALVLQLTLAHGTATVHCRARTTNRAARLRRPATITVAIIMQRQHLMQRRHLRCQVLEALAAVAMQRQVQLAAV